MMEMTIELTLLTGRNGWWALRIEMMLANEVEILTAVVEVVPPAATSAAVGILATLSLETIALAEAELGSLLAAKLITTFLYEIDLLELVETGK